jgi:hypothetical protein
MEQNRYPEYSLYMTEKMVLLDALLEIVPFIFFGFTGVNR